MTPRSGTSSATADCPAPLGRPSIPPARPGPTGEGSRPPWPPAGGPYVTVPPAANPGGELRGQLAETVTAAPTAAPTINPTLPPTSTAPVPVEPGPGAPIGLPLQVGLGL